MFVINAETRDLATIPESHNIFMKLQLLVSNKYIESTRKFFWNRLIMKCFGLLDKFLKSSGEYLSNICSTRQHFLQIPSNYHKKLQHP